MQQPTEFRVLDASADVIERPLNLSVEASVKLVMSKSRAAGQPSFDAARSPLLKVSPPISSGHPFLVRGVPGREGRPRHPQADPLSLEAARAINQPFVVLDTRVGALTALENPFGYMEECMTWATRDFVRQVCGDNERHWLRAFRMQLLICSELQSAVVGFNETVHNSLDRLHVVSHRPPAGLGRYPVQLVAADNGVIDAPGVIHLGPHNGYPTDVWRICYGHDDTTAEIAATLVAKWRRLGGEHAAASAGAFVENGVSALYVVPRHRLLTAVGWHSGLAFLEMLGVFIAGQRSDYLRVKRGIWTHEHFVRVLSSIRPADAWRVELPSVPAVT